ncbi:hypothetical protein HPP92_010229 [Vanilla planifolia]|uniref:Uncharacterized protein n=1 Tax=Vanilla planifolia TaxID=51239 RepID=A0A835QY71_VANPL|nr:hypothetical protein HPP92_010229 [Vanilla planifolia]
MDIYDSLFKHIRESRLGLEDASSNTDLQQGNLEHAKAMGHALCFAKDLLYDCGMVSWKVRAMIQSAETSINAAKKHKRSDVDDIGAFIEYITKVMKLI